MQAGHGFLGWTMLSANRTPWGGALPEIDAGVRRKRVRQPVLFPRGDSNEHVEILGFLSTRHLD